MIQARNEAAKAKSVQAITQESPFQAPRSFSEMDESGAAEMTDQEMIDALETESSFNSPPHSPAHYKREISAIRAKTQPDQSMPSLPQKGKRVFDETENGTETGDQKRIVSDDTPTSTPPLTPDAGTLPLGIH